MTTQGQSYHKDKVKSQDFPRSQASLATISELSPNSKQEAGGLNSNFSMRR